MQGDKPFSSASYETSSNMRCCGSMDLASSDATEKNCAETLAANIHENEIDNYLSIKSRSVFFKEMGALE